MSERIHVLEKGPKDGDAVICLHGVLGSSRNILKLINAIGEAGFRAIGFDQRGHGHSPWSDDYGLDTLAGDVFAVMDELGAKSAHLVGHSMGARVALAAATLQPGRARSVVMLDAGVKASPAAANSVRQVIDRLAPSYTSKAEAETALSEFEPSTRQWLLSMLRAADHGFRWTFDLEGIRSRMLEALRADQSKAFRELRCPTLVVRGELSSHLSEKEVREMLALKPAARAATITAADHWVHVDNFEETARTVIDFLKGISL
jgi:esterase